MAVEAPPPKSEGSSDQSASHDSSRMSFLEHLDELRRRLTYAALGLLVGVGACYAVADDILAFLLNPITETMGQLSVIRPAEAFMNNLKAAFVGGIFVSLPWIFYQAWAFVAPGMYPKERRWALPAILAASVLFLTGAAFCYSVALPTATNFLAEQGEQFESNITVDYAFRFASKLLLGLGAVFELPVVIFILARMRLVTAKVLWKRIDVAVFVCFLAAAILTPTPDMLTMTIFALPMVALYIVGIAVAWLAAPRDEKKEEES